MEWKWMLGWATDTAVGGISLLNWTIAAFIALAAYLAMTTALRIAIHRLDSIRHRTTSRIDDFMVEVLSGTNRVLLGVAAILVGVGMLELGPHWGSRVDHLWFLALGMQIALWVNRAITISTRHHLVRQEAGVMKASATATLMIWALRVVLWSVVLLAMLSNLGVNITAFVASLGVGGIAVALAVQNILGDLFASLSIAVDKPFEVGDFIIMGDVLGSVEQVGLKTTRLRSLGGEQIILSNTALLKNTIRNYKRMDERRVAFNFGVTYETSPEHAEEISAIVKRIIQSHDKARFDRAHLKGFGPGTFDYEVVYYVLGSDFNLYMDIQQSINLQLIRELRKLDVRFAVPAQAMYLANVRPESSSPESTVQLRTATTSSRH